MPPESQESPNSRPNDPVLPTTAPYERWVAGPEVLRVPPAEPPPGWSRPRPERLPRATYWPSVLAFGVMLTVWGPLTTWVMTGVGLAFVVVAIRGWILELLNEAETPE